MLRPSWEGGSVSATQNLVLVLIMLAFAGAEFLSKRHRQFLLFFWDVLSGTAHITRKYPAQVGMRDDLVFGKERWYAEMFYPLVASKREHSALAPGGKTYAENETQALPLAR
jgi:hypothetical protein